MKKFTEIYRLNIGKQTMKKSSRDRRVFRRAMPTLLSTNELTESMDKAASLARFAGADLSQLQAAMQTINGIMIDSAQAQKAFADFKSTCDNLSKLKINISIY